MLKSDIVDIFIIGDFDNNEIVRMFNDNFNVNTVKKPGGSHFIEHEKIKKTVKKEKETMAVEQTNLNIGFKLKDLTDFERQYVLYIYCFILGGVPIQNCLKLCEKKIAYATESTPLTRPFITLFI